MSLSAPPSLTPGEKLSRAAIWMIGLAAMIWVLQTTQEIILPATLALVVGVVFAPLADWIDRLGASRVICSLAVLFVVLGVVVGGTLIFYPVVSDFISRLPLFWAELEASLSGLKSTMESVEEVQEEVAGTINNSDHDLEQGEVGEETEEEAV